MVMIPTNYFSQRNNFMTLDVYYGELTYEFIEQTQAYTLENFFSKSYFSSDSVEVMGHYVTNHHWCYLKLTPRSTSYVEIQQ